MIQPIHVSTVAAVALSLMAVRQADAYLSRREPASGKVHGACASRGPRRQPCAWYLDWTTSLAPRWMGTERSRWLGLAILSFAISGTTEAPAATHHSLASIRTKIGRLSCFTTASMAIRTFSILWIALVKMSRRCCPPNQRCPWTLCARATKEAWRVWGSSNRLNAPTRTHIASLPCCLFDPNPLTRINADRIGNRRRITTPRRWGALCSKGLNREIPRDSASAGLPYTDCYESRKKLAIS